MERLKSIGMIWVLIFTLLNSGCVSLLTMGAEDFSLFGLSMATGPAAEIQKEITKADIKKIAAADFETTEAIVQKTFRALDIEIKEIQKNAKGDGGGITGTTAKHEEIRVLIAQVTSRTTRIGIWSKINLFERDGQFSHLIGQEINRRLAKIPSK